MTSILSKTDPELGATLQRMASNPEASGDSQVDVSKLLQMVVAATSEGNPEIGDALARLGALVNQD